MERFNCQSCGGAITRIGPGRYKCEYCGEPQIFDADDVKISRALNLEDEKILSEIKLLKELEREKFERAEHIKEQIEQKKMSFQPLLYILIGSGAFSIILLFTLGTHGIGEAIVLMFISACILFIIIAGREEINKLKHDIEELENDSLILAKEILDKEDMLSISEPVYDDEEGDFFVINQPDNLKKCESCGGELTRVGLAEYICDRCQSEHVIEHKDKKQVEQIKLDDVTIKEEVRLLNQKLFKIKEDMQTQERNAKWSKVTCVIISVLIITIFILKWAGAIPLADDPELKNIILYFMLFLLINIIAILIYIKYCSIKTKSLAKEYKKVMAAINDNTKLLAIRK